jgi:hypothetical protein
MKVMIALLILVLPGASLGQIQARSAHGTRASGAESTFAGGSSPAGGATGQCEKLCANDSSPCDPIYFKTEDGRCAGIFTR